MQRRCGRWLARDLGERVHVGQRQPRGGIVRLGTCGRRRDRGLHRDERVVHDRFGLGDDRGLDVGIGLEQVFDAAGARAGRSGSGSHAAASCGCARARATADRASRRARAARGARANSVRVARRATRRSLVLGDRIRLRSSRGESVVRVGDGAVPAPCCEHEGADGSEPSGGRRNRLACRRRSGRVPEHRVRVLARRGRDRGEWSADRGGERGADVDDPAPVRSRVHGAAPARGTARRSPRACGRAVWTRPRRARRRRS